MNLYLKSMAITINDVALRNSLGDDIIARLNAGTTNATGRLVFQTSGDVTLSVNTLTNPAAPGFASGTTTFSAIANGTIAATGTVAKFVAQNRDETVIFTGNVTATGGGGDITFNTVSWVAGDTCSVSSLTLTVPGA